MSELSRLGNEPFVSLTTFRRNGEGVATPVWVARDGDALIVLTPEESYKVGRVRRDPRVRLVPSTRTGRVKDTGPPVDGTAEVVADPDETGRQRDVIRRKYGWQYRATLLIERLLARREKPRVILRITVPSGL
jgi:PPOX class probable F420-dependent enzyme